ncbi:MAG: hypothetical protein M0P97_03385 [Candidatus Moranbacteria bacterium]|jgi:hypothetical protein|nr:hypothetical protein [Candidatus Moranbacteria bacterium]
MEKFELPFNNIVGGKQKNKDDVKENWKKESDEFLRKNEFKYAGLEKNLTKDEVLEIEKIKHGVNDIAQYYGATKKLSPKIIILEPGSVYKITQGKFKSGVCSPYMRRIMVDSCESKLDFATTLAHEMFHMSEYTSLIFSQETDDTELRRAGISIFGKDGETVYFANIEEALIAEAVQDFVNQYLRKNPQFVDEIKKTDFVKNWLGKFYDYADVPKEKQKEFLDSVYSFPDIDNLIERLNGNDNEEFKFGFLNGYLRTMFENDDVVMRERMDERKKLDSLVDMILSSSENEYTSRKEIVDVFMRANFSGKLLPLARLIEKSLGKGSFRSIGADSSVIK